MTRLPQRTKLVAVAGLGLVLAAVLVKFFVLRPPQPVVSPPLVVHHHAHAATETNGVDKSLPATLRRALARHPIVVAVLYGPGVPGDGEAVAAAREGAQSAHAGFAALDIRNETIARDAALKLAATSDPEVLVIRRPGKVAFALPGFADSALVAQATAVRP